MSYYSYDRVLSYNALLNFILTNRGLGKSYGAKERVIKNFIKKGEQFIYVRRYKEEFKKKKLWFEDIKNAFPKDEFVVDGWEGKINGKVGGYFIPLSTSQKEKSTAYPNVTTIIFDEFIIDKGHIRYLQNEVEVMLDLIETVARKRDNVKIIFLANNISLVNPYFIYFNCIPKPNQRFTLAQNGEVVVEVFADDEFITEKKNTRFGRLINGTSYGDYAIDNKTLRDNDKFIQSWKPKDSKFVFSVTYRGSEVGVWLSAKEGICFVSKDIQTSSKYRFAITKEDHDINLIMYNNLNEFNMFREFTKFYKQGYVRFKDQETKNKMFDILQYMNVR